MCAWTTVCWICAHQQTRPFSSCSMQCARCECGVGQQLLLDLTTSSLSPTVRSRQDIVACGTAPSPLMSKMDGPNTFLAPPPPTHIQLFREALLGLDFQEIHTPKLIAGASEGGAAVFR